MFSGEESGCGKREREKAERERAEKHTCGSMLLWQSVGIENRVLEGLVDRAMAGARDMGDEGLVDGAVRYSAMRLQRIGGKQGYEITASWWRTKFESKGHETYRSKP